MSENAVPGLRQDIQETSFTSLEEVHDDNEYVSIQTSQINGVSNVKQFQASRQSDGQRILIANEGGDTSQNNYGSFEQSHANGDTTQSSIQPISQDVSSSIAQAASKPARILGPDLLRGLLMVLQAIDHSAMGVGAWPHGTAQSSEADSSPVSKWNSHIGWTARMLTHLCAPGFMFLLGMGVVYFGKSRRKLGWGTLKMVNHFAVRALVLILVNEAIGLPITGGRILVLNIVLIALAINYLFAGLLWLAVDWSEGFLARCVLERLMARDQDADEHTGHQGHNGQATPGGNTTDDEAQPLLNRKSAQQGPESSTQQCAASISFHLHNFVLFILAGVTIWWNIWFSPTHGHCSLNSTRPPPPFEPQPTPDPVFQFFFHMLQTTNVISAFPPLAWISFAILGLLYGRIITSLHWPHSKPARISAANAVIGILFAALFVATRLLHFGNLSEGCLHMSEHELNPDTNQYTASFRSFFYVVKYPPDVAFASFTLSLLFLFLSLFGFVPATWATKVPFSILLTYGTCALFFYAIHLPLYVCLGTVVKQIWGKEMPWEDQMDRGHNAIGVGEGWEFWLYYFLGLALLWVLCRWYGRFKAKKGPDSVWRFF